MKKLQELGLGPRFRKLAGWGVWAIIIFVVISTIGNINKVLQIRADVQKEKERLAKMEAENAKLEAEVKKTQGVDFVEKEVRDKLGLVKEGETVVVLPDEETLRSLAPKIDNSEETLPDPIWKRWLKLFL